MLACAFALLLTLPVLRATAAPAVSVAEWISRVEMALDERDTKGANEWLQPLLERNDLASARRAEVLWLSARLKRMEGQNEAAMEAAGGAVNLARESGDGELLVQLLQDRALLGTLADDIETVRSDLNALVRLGTDGGEPQVVFDAGTFAMRLVGPEKGIALLVAHMIRTSVDERGVDLSSGLLTLGDLVLAKGDAEGALRAYNRLVDGNQQGSAAFTGRAGAHILLGQLAEARADLESARAQVKREPSSLERDMAVEGVAELAQQLEGLAPSAESLADDWLAQVRAAIDAGKWEDARNAAESAIMRDRNARAPREALAEVYLLHGEYDGAVNVFSSMSGLPGESRLPNAGGTLAQALKGIEVYDVEGFAEDWITLTPAQKGLLRRTVQAARERGPLPATAARMVAVIEFRASSDKLP